MKKWIASVLLAGILLAALPGMVFAEEIQTIAETTAPTEANVETDPPAPTEDTSPTQETEATETTHETEAAEATQGTETTEPTQETEATDPTQGTEATEPTQETEATDPTQGTEATEPTQETEATDPTQETEATEPTQETEATDPTQSTAPTQPQIPTSLEIDTKHIYPGMNKPYEDGYMPQIQNGVVHLVLPLLSNGSIYGDALQVSLNLGSSAASPFEIANYEKTFSLETRKPENSEDPVELFLISFDVKLSGSRSNGVYPVTANVSGYDDAGTAIACSYTLYVTITDGKSNEPPKTYVETPTAEPVVFIAKRTMTPEKAMAGEEFTLTLTLKNSLTTKSVKNMLVRVETGDLHMELLEDTNVFPIEKLPAGGETTLTLRFRTDASIPAGKYPLNFSFHYDSSKTLNLSSAGSAVVEVQQPANMELVMPRFPQSVTVGETIPLSLQVMNMGRAKMYNVRCVVSGYGFAPSNTGFLGEMAAGSSATTKVELYIIALNASAGNENGNQYGDTTGTVTLIYEDETGTEYQQETTFETTVKRPIASIAQTDNAQEELERAASQWWRSVLILGGVLLVAGIAAILYHNRKTRGGLY